GCHRGHSSRPRYSSIGVFATTGRPDPLQPTIAHVQLAAATPPAAGQLMLPFRPSYGLRDTRERRENKIDVLSGVVRDGRHGTGRCLRAPESLREVRGAEKRRDAVAGCP